MVISPGMDRFLFISFLSEDLYAAMLVFTHQFTCGVLFCGYFSTKTHLMRYSYQLALLSLVSTLGLQVKADVDSLIIKVRN